MLLFSQFTSTPKPMDFLPHAETWISTQFRLKETFYFTDGTTESTYRTVTRLIAKPSHVDVQGHTLTTWQEHNPNITKITHTYTPVITEETNIEHFKLANTIHLLSQVS